MFRKRWSTSDDSILFHGECLENPWNSWSWHGFLHVFFGQPKICPSNAGENGDCFLSRWPRPFFNEVPQELLGNPGFGGDDLMMLKRWQRADHVDGCVWKWAIGIPVYPQKNTKFSDRPPSVIWWFENCCHWAVWGIGVSCLKHLDQA